MQRDIVERVGFTEQNRLDEWFDRAMSDESVRPYLTTGMHFPRLEIPEEVEEGVVLMNRQNTGVLKLYFDIERQTADLGVWVLTPQDETHPSRGFTAMSLMVAACTICQQYPLIKFMSARVMSTNYHGQAFFDRLMNHWGVEEAAVFDTSRKSHQLGKWANWIHYRAPIRHVENGIWSWDVEKGYALAG